MLVINETDLAQLQDFAESGVEEAVKAQRYPALQVNQYRDVKPNTKLSLCFAEESWNLIPDHLKAKLDATFEEVFYQDDKETGIYKVSYIRFVPLAIPSIFKENKKTGVVSALSPFIPGDRTIAKLFLAVIVKDEVLTLEDGSPLVVTLKLRSYKTQEVIGEANESGTLRNLSSELTKNKIGKAGRSNIHFVNLEIAPASKVYKNAEGESSRSVAYELRSAKINSKEVMTAISTLFQNEELLEAMKDPFRLKVPTGELGGDAARELIIGEILRSVSSDSENPLDTNNALEKFLMSRFGSTSLTRLTVEELLQCKSMIDTRQSNDLDSIPF